MKAMRNRKMRFRLETGEQSTPFGLSQHRQQCHALLRVCRERFEQNAQMAGHSLDRGSIELASVEIETRCELLVRGHNQCQRIISFLPRVMNLGSAACRTLPHHALDGIILESDDSIEQLLIAWRLAPSLKLRQRAIFVLPRFCLLFLYSPEPGNHLYVWRNPHTHRKRVYEVARHRFDAVQIGRPA